MKELIKNIPTQTTFTKFILSSLKIKECDEKLITDNVKVFYNALILHDFSKLQKLAIRELNYSYSDLKTVNKSSFLNSIKNESINSIEITNQTIHFASNVAIVRHQISKHTSVDIIVLRVMMVWVKENKNWFLLANQTFNC
jgi:hypothetical protein